MMLTIFVDIPSLESLFKKMPDRTLSKAACTYRKAEVVVYLFRSPESA